MLGVMDQITLIIPTRCEDRKQMSGNCFNNSKKWIEILLIYKLPFVILDVFIVSFSIA